jgi:hypothetical protein
MKTIILYILVFFISCEKETIKNEVKPPKIEWRKQLGPKLNDQIALDPILYENDLLFGYQTEFSTGYYRYNKNSGELIQNYPDINSFYCKSYQVGDNYFSIFGSTARTINLKTNQIENFRIALDSSAQSVFASVYLNSLFLPVHNSINFNKNYSLNEYKIARAQGNLNQWNIVWSNKYNKEQGMFGTHIKYLAIEKNKLNEEIIYFPSQLLYTDLSKKSRYKVEAVNITQNKLLWETNAFEVDSMDFGNLSNFAPQIVDNLVICGISGSHLMAFDKNKGNLVWSLYFNNENSNTKMIIHNKKITIMDNTSTCYLIDANTGAILRKQNIIGGAAASWASHKGLVYFTTASGKLYCVDANNLDILWELTSPNKPECSYCNFFFASPLVDPATNRLYISDRKEVICYQLPK